VNKDFPLYILVHYSNPTGKSLAAVIQELWPSTILHLPYSLEKTPPSNRHRPRINVMHRSEVHVCYTTAAQLNWMMIQSKYWEQVGKLFSAAKSQKKTFYNFLVQPKDEANRKLRRRRMLLGIWRLSYPYSGVFHSGYWLNWLRLNMSRNSTATL